MRYLPPPHLPAPHLPAPHPPEAPALSFAFGVADGLGLAPTFSTCFGATTTLGATFFGLAFGITLAEAVAAADEAAGGAL